jgi:VanZ family protein
VASAASQRSATGPLALVYAALILYASLYPFAGWRWPPGVPVGALLALPWPPWRDAFDVTSNILGYMPLGLLLYVWQVRSERHGVRAGLVAAAIGAAVSFAMEVTQQFLPGRVPSRVDWVLNCTGAALGATVAAALHSLGLLRRWQNIRERWFVADSAGALALLALWPFALLFPTPLPLGLGHVGGPLREALVELLDDVPWAQGVQNLLESPGTTAGPLSPWLEAAVPVLGLLAPCLVAYAVVRPGRRRIYLACGALLLALGTSALSTALSFGPTHAWAWLTPLSLPALVGGTLLAVAGWRMPVRAAALAGLLVMSALLLLVAQAPLDPYFAISLHGWEQGRFIRFHGLAQWIGWLWPFVAMAWLVLRLTRPQPR